MSGLRDWNELELLLSSAGAKKPFIEAVLSNFVPSTIEIDRRCKFRH